MELKKRFKLFKSGKSLCTMAVLFASTGIGLSLVTPTVRADTSVPLTTEVKSTSTDTKTDVAADTKTDVAKETQETQSSVISPVGQPNSFVKQNDQTYHYDQQGSLYHGWYENWGNKYYFQADGVLKTNQFLTDQRGKVYYFDQAGVMYRDKFYQNWGHTYYFGNDGARYTNQWYENWGNKYYFGQDGALLQNQFLTDQQGKVYYFDRDGVMYRNKFYQNWGHTYYFGNDGARYTNQWYENWGNKYYFGQDGALLTNQFLTDQQGKIYYFNQAGVMYRNKFYQNWGNVYYFTSTGSLKTDGWYGQFHFNHQGILDNLTDTMAYKVVNWFDRHVGKLTYSMHGSRNGSDGTADCSGSMTSALISAGAKGATQVYDTSTIPDFLIKNGFKRIYEGYDFVNPQYGDIVIWGKRWITLGGKAHMGIVSTFDQAPKFYSVNWGTKGKPGTAVSNDDYNQYVKNHGKRYTYVYRLM